MKTKILTFLRRTQKATGALLGAVTTAASATFVPEQWRAYAVTASVILTWVLTFVLPYVTKIVEESPIPDDAPKPVVVPSVDDIEDPADPTVEIAAIVMDSTAGIPVIDGEDSGIRPEPGPTVDEILGRLRAEGSTSVY